jgi:prolyl oligopeptidase
MKKLFVVSIPVFLIVCLLVFLKNMQHAPSADESVQDDYFGTLVPDPYRWLENPDTPATRAWVTAQNARTFAHLDKIPYRKSIGERLSALWNYEKMSAPSKEGDRYYFFRNDGLQNQSVLYARQTADGVGEEIVLDPNTLSADGTVSVGGVYFSKNGRYLAYDVVDGGSDWRTVYVKDLQTGQTLPDKVEWTKFSGVAWSDDGFYYGTYPVDQQGQLLSDKNEFQQIRYHRLGTAVQNDPLVYEDPANPDHGFSVQTTDDGRYLLLYPARSTSGNALYVRDLSAPATPFAKLIEGFDHDYGVVGSEGSKLFVLTNHGAPTYRLVEIDVQRPAPADWKTLVPATEQVLTGVHFIGGRFVCQYLRNAASEMLVYTRQGQLAHRIALPELGTVGSVNGKPESNEAFFTFTSFVRPTSVYRLDVATGAVALHSAPKLTFDPDAYETKQVFYTSADGTSVPMFITAKKNLPLDSQRPTLLYGYGGFNISVTPGFKPQVIALLEQGGIYAVANIRGGGEFGETWHRSGTKLQKKNVFQDFIGAAEYLIAQQYTQPARLAIEGRSNGGLLVGACMTMRPDLFGVCFPGVGVMDMLRYHRFTIGYFWADDYGRSDESREMFEYLYSYSPVHNCRPAQYPATMITTADHDDRVVPAHSYKFAAALQAAQQGPAPCLIRIDVRAGHGAGKPTTMVIEEETDKLAFLLHQMGVESLSAH